MALTLAGMSLGDSPSTPRSPAHINGAPIITSQGVMLYNSPAPPVSPPHVNMARGNDLQPGSRPATSGDDGRRFTDDIDGTQAPPSRSSVSRSSFQKAMATPPAPLANLARGGDLVRGQQVVVPVEQYHQQQQHQHQQRQQQQQQGQRQLYGQPLAPALSAPFSAPHAQFPGFQAPIPNPAAPHGEGFSIFDANQPKPKMKEHFPRPNQPKTGSNKGGPKFADNVEDYWSDYSDRNAYEGDLSGKTSIVGEIAWKAPMQAGLQNSMLLVGNEVTKKAQMYENYSSAADRISNLDKYSNAGAGGARAAEQIMGPGIMGGMGAPLGGAGGMGGLADPMAAMGMGMGMWSAEEPAGHVDTKLSRVSSPDALSAFGSPGGAFMHSEAGSTPGASVGSSSFSPQAPHSPAPSQPSFRAGRASATAPSSAGLGATEYPGDFEAVDDDRP